MFDPPTVGLVSTLTLQTHDDSSLPPLPIQVEIHQSGACLVAGREPGFVAKVLSFYSDADSQRYQDLVAWLTHGMDR
jgi:hypothetical protein